MSTGSFGASAFLNCLRFVAYQAVPCASCRSSVPVWVAITRHDASPPPPDSWGMVSAMRSSKAPA